MQQKISQLTIKLQKYKTYNFKFCNYFIFLFGIISLQNYLINVFKTAKIKIGRKHDMEKRGGGGYTW